MVKAKLVIASRCITPGRPALSTSFEEMKRSDDIGVNKVSRARDRTIDMGFGGEMHDMGNAMLAHDLGHGGSFPQIHLGEDILGVMRRRGQIGQMARVGQTIQVDQTPDLGSINHVMDQIGSNKAGASGDK
jgi:hypothetical protein